MKVYLTESHVAFILEAMELWQERYYRWPLAPGHEHAKEIKLRLLNAVESFERRKKANA